MTLMLHCGANAVTRDVLAQLPVPQPRGPRHVIRPFIEDVEVVMDRLGDIGATLDADAYGVLYDTDGAPRRYFGLLEIRLQGAADTMDYALQIGLRGSYDQSISRGLAVGSRVFVCDNLAMSSEVVIKTRQTTNLGARIPRFIGQSVMRVPEFAEHQANRFARLKNTTLTRQQGDAMLVEMVRRGALTASQLGKALEQWDRPDHTEHAEYGLSAWRLHNAVTEALKAPTSPNALGQTWVRSTVMTRFLDELVDLPEAA